MMTLFEQQGGTYQTRGDYFIPCVVTKDKKEVYIGVWANHHRQYLKQFHRVRYYNLLTSERLYGYLADIEEQAGKMFEELIKELSEKENVTEKLKEDKPMLWVQKMNSIRNRATEFYELYKDNEKVSTLLTQLNWSNHLKIMSACKTMEERIFYMSMCVKEKYSARELARQIDSGYYERYMLSQKPLTPAIEESRRATGNFFLDNYVLDFLDVPETVSERDLQKSIIRNLKDFILEIGKNFTFIGEEYRVQVGKHDYYIDLLFYHRGLSCLVAFELKIGEFKPEYVGKINLYLEALDREVKKDNENPSVGVILCASKDDEVVEFALSRSLSPTMVSEYNLKLIDKKLLQKKLKEYIELAGTVSEEE